MSIGKSSFSYYNVIYLFVKLQSRFSRLIQIVYLVCFDLISMFWSPSWAKLVWYLRKKENGAIWKTKSLLFCLRYDPLIVFPRQNHITFIDVTWPLSANGLLVWYLSVVGWEIQVTRMQLLWLLRFGFPTISVPREGRNAKNKKR